MTSSFYYRKCREPAKMKKEGVMEKEEIFRTAKQNVEEGER